MRISGFSFVRNGDSLYYPVAEAVRSILPLVDEFVVAVGSGDPGDKTREAIESIGDRKIRIIDTVWEERFCNRGVINAIQTDVAKEACSGDWLFYLQADEVVHEKDLPKIRNRCDSLLHRHEVEGLLFRYRHFWGDYDHYHDSHRWYPREIRIIRNRPDIHSFESAQSFRSFDPYIHPRQSGGTRKLRVAEVDAEIFHYGWVRPPRLMQAKSRAFFSIHWGRREADSFYDREPELFDYGPLNRLERFQGTHPAVMLERIEKMNWKDALQHGGRPDPRRKKHKHEQLRYRLLTWCEKRLFGGRRLFSFENYCLLRDI